MRRDGTAHIREETVQFSWGKNMAELWRSIRDSLGARRFVRGFGDGWFWLALLLGVAGLPFQGGVMPPPWRLASVAITEELAYRVLLQQQLEQMVKGRRGLFTAGCLLASVVFALSHLPTHPPIMAGLTFFPSLAFGAIWTRHRSLWLCAVLHFWYNLAFFL